MKESLKGSPVDLKGSPEDKPHHRKRRRQQAPPVSDFEQLRRDTLGAGDRAAYIQGDSMKRNAITM